MGDPIGIQVYKASADKQLLSQMISLVCRPKCLKSDAFRLGTSENISRGSLTHMMLADEPAYHRRWYMSAEA